MSNKALRLSPSGPVVQNDSGGPFVPGPGARLRLVNGFTTCTAYAIPTAGGVIGPVPGTTALVQSLPAPNPNLQYRARIRCDVENPATTDAAVTLYIDTSTDGASWTLAASNVHAVSGGAVSPNNGARQIELDVPLSFGGSLGVTSDPPSPTLYVRSRISAPASGGVQCIMRSDATAADSVGSIYLELEETL